MHVSDFAFATTEIVNVEIPLSSIITNQFSSNLRYYRDKLIRKHPYA